MYKKSVVNEEPFIANILKAVYPFFGESEFNISDPAMLRLGANVSMSGFAKRASQRLPEALEECKWMSQNIECSEYFKEVVTQMGLCFTFNSIEFIKNHGGKPLETHGTGILAQNFLQHSRLYWWDGNVQIYSNYAVHP